MKALLFIIIVLLSGCVWQFALMKDCDKKHDKQHHIYYNDYCEFNNKVK